MIKYIYCVRKPDAMSGDDFRSYWLNQHAPLFKHHAEAMGVKRYVQAHTLEDPVNAQLQKARGGLPPFDGVGEVWWDSFDQMTTALATPQGREASRILTDDNVNFLDRSRSSAFIAEVHTIIGGED